MVTGPDTPRVDLTFREADFAPVGERLDLGDDDQVQAAIHQWIERFGLRRPYPVAPPLETSVHENDGGDQVLFVLNPTGDSHRAEITLTRPVTGTDCLGGQRFEGDDRLVVPMPPRTVRMLALETPARAEATPMPEADS